MPLSPEDHQHYLTFQRRCNFLRDRTQSVAGAYQTGVYICGRPGSGKTFTVLKTLKEIKDAKYIFRNSRMTPMGLYEELAEHPEHVFVLDDIPSLLDHRQALQILMAALGGKPGEARPVTYSTKRKNDRRSLKFSGGIICISNVPLRHDPLAEAIVSRVVLHEHDPSDEELAAVMRHTAMQGTNVLTPGECLEVVECVISQCRTHDFRLDLRYLDKGLQDYRQFKEGKTLCSWEDLIQASMKQVHEPNLFAKLSKQQEIELECERVLQLMRAYPGNTPRQIAESALSKTTFYERRRMLKQAGRI